MFCLFLNDRYSGFVYVHGSYLSLSCVAIRILAAEHYCIDLHMPFEYNKATRLVILQLPSRAAKFNGELQEKELSAAFAANTSIIP